MKSATILTPPSTGKKLYVFSFKLLFLVLCWYLMVPPVALLVGLSTYSICVKLQHKQAYFAKNLDFLLCLCE